MDNQPEFRTSSLLLITAMMVSGVMALFLWLPLTRDTKPVAGQKSASRTLRTDSSGKSRLFATPAPSRSEESRSNSTVGMTRLASARAEREFNEPAINEPRINVDAERSGPGEYVSPRGHDTAAARPVSDFVAGGITVPVTVHPVTVTVQAPDQSSAILSAEMARMHQTLLQMLSHQDASLRAVRELAEVRQFSRPQTTTESAGQTRAGENWQADQLQSIQEKLVRIDETIRRIESEPQSKTPTPGPASVETSPARVAEAPRDLSTALESFDSPFLNSQADQPQPTSATEAANRSPSVDSSLLNEMSPILDIKEPSQNQPPQTQTELDQPGTGTSAETDNDLFAPQTAIDFSDPPRPATVPATPDSDSSAASPALRIPPSDQPASMVSATVEWSTEPLDVTEESVAPRKSRSAVEALIASRSKITPPTPVPAVPNLPAIDDQAIQQTTATTMSESVLPNHNHDEQVQQRNRPIDGTKRSWVTRSTSYVRNLSWMPDFDTPAWVDRIPRPERPALFGGEKSSSSKSKPKKGKVPAPVDRAIYYSQRNDDAATAGQRRVANPIPEPREYVSGAGNTPPNSTSRLVVRPKSSGTVSRNQVADTQQPSTSSRQTASAGQETKQSPSAPGVLPVSFSKSALSPTSAAPPVPPVPDSAAQPVTGPLNAKPRPIRTSATRPLQPQANRESPVRPCPPGTYPVRVSADPRSTNSSANTPERSKPASAKPSTNRFQSSLKTGQSVESMLESKPVHRLTASVMYANKPRAIDDASGLPGR